MKINNEAESELIKKQMVKTQDNWITHFNNKKEKMISAPDIYEASKSADKELLDSLRKDFQESWIVTSTRIIYDKHRTNAEIVHDFGSKMVKETRYGLDVPVFQGDFKEDKATETFLQSLFGTKDKLKTILKNLASLRETKTMILWTPTQDGRKDRPERAVRFGYYVGRFLVDGYWVDDFSGGLSRGVSVKSAKPTAKRK